MDVALTAGGFNEKQVSRTSSHSSEADLSFTPRFRAAPDFTVEDELGCSQVIPYAGSKLHSSGKCKPCAFMFKEEGCSNGASCQFCHLCMLGEKKLRKKAWKEQKKVRSLFTQIEQAEFYEPGSILAASATTAPAPMPVCSTAAPALSSSRCSTADSEEPAEVELMENIIPPIYLHNSLAFNSPHLDMPPGLADACVEHVPLATPMPPVLLPEPLPWQENAFSEALTVGSMGHELGMCKPCAFVFKDGCASGSSCRFCHLCMPGEKKLRKKLWKEQQKSCMEGVGTTEAVAWPR